MEVVEGIKIVLFFAGAILVAVSIVNAIDSAANSESIKLRGFVIAGIVIALSVFVPSKSTIMEMTIASYVTEDNYKAAKGEATDLIDYIIEKVHEETSQD